jgi:hypothetical protein
MTDPNYINLDLELLLASLIRNTLSNAYAKQDHQCDATLYSILKES